MELLQDVRLQISQLEDLLAKLALHINNVELLLQLGKWLCKGFCRLHYLTIDWALVVTTIDCQVKLYRGGDFLRSHIVSQALKAKMSLASQTKAWVN